jgi:hypothetical protein
MAVTTNLVIPELLTRIVPAWLKDNFLLYKVGVASLEFPEDIKGNYYRFRQWNPLAGSSVVNDGSATGSATQFAQFEEIGVRNKRFFEISFTDAEITQAEDLGPEQFTQQVVGPAYGAYWVKEFHRLITLHLTGLFTSGGCLATTHKHVITDLIDRTAVNRAEHTLGERNEELGAMFVHPDVHEDIVNEGLVQYLDNISGITASGRVPTYLGMVLYQDANLPTSGAGATKTYMSFMTAPKSLQFALDGSARVYQQETTNPPKRNISQAVDFVSHVRGTKYVAATVPPTDAALAAAASWQKSHATDSPIQVVCLETYAGVNA